MRMFYVDVGRWNMRTRSGRRANLQLINLQLPDWFTSSAFACNRMESERVVELCTTVVRGCVFEYLNFRVLAHAHAHILL